MDIFQPVVVLVGWTLVMLAWTLAVRLPALRAAGVDMNTLVGAKAADADRVLPPQVQWKAHNYNHLLEQPVLFYAITIVLALSVPAGGGHVWLAWGYTVLRIAHSLVQATHNRVKPRLILFLLSSALLAGLTVRAVIAVF